MDTLLGEAIVPVFLPPVCLLYRPFREDPFLEGGFCREKQTRSHKCVSLVSKRRKIYRMYIVPLKLLSKDTPTGACIYCIGL